MNLSIKLRCPRIVDLKPYHENKNDKELDKGFISYTYPYTLTEARKDLCEAISNNRKEDCGNFIIEFNGELAGEISYSLLIPKLSAKISYWVGKEFRRKGIATKAVILMDKFLRRKFGVKRIYGNVRVHNKASAKVLEKAGFKLEGIQRKSSMKKGKYFDDFLYAKIK